MRAPCAGWVDEYLFGWSQSQAPKTPGIESDMEGAMSDFEGGVASGLRSGYVSGYTTEEPDYDEVRLQKLSPWCPRIWQSLTPLPSFAPFTPLAPPTPTTRSIRSRTIKLPFPHPQVINILSREQGVDPSDVTTDTGDTSAADLLRYRRNSRSRSRSQLDLTAMHAASASASGVEEKEGARERKGAGAGDEE